MPDKTTPEPPNSVGDDAHGRTDMFGAETPPCSYNKDTHVVSAIKVGTIAHTMYGEPYECKAPWMEAHAADWTNGALIANHNGEYSEKFGSIIQSWFEDPFIMMEIGNMNAEAERRMLAGEHTGFSFDAVGDPIYSDDVRGTNLSILFYPHSPACSIADGCGLAAESQSQDVIQTEDIKNIGSEAMDNREFTVAEIESIKAEAAKVAAKLATLEAEAKTHEGEVVAYKAEITERGDMISVLKETATTLFAAEDVEIKVNEAQATMFSAEDVEAATKEAVTTAIAAAAEKTKQIAAALAAVNNMYPDGLDPEFKEGIVAMIMDGKSHEALVKLGEGVEYKSLKAQIPTTSAKDAIEAEDEPTNGFTVGDCKGV